MAEKLSIIINPYLDECMDKPCPLYKGRTLLNPEMTLEEAEDILSGVGLHVDSQKGSMRGFYCTQRCDDEDETCGVVFLFRDHVYG